jgi:hypothetical protein
MDVNFEGRSGEEEDVANAALGVDGGSASLMVVGGAKGLESCEVSVASDELSSSATIVDEVLHVNAGSSVGTGVFLVAAMSSVPLSAGSSVVGMAVIFLPHASRQVITDVGHPPCGTEISAKVKSQ